MQHLSQHEIERRIEQAVASDERWRVIVRGCHWLCPYCRRLGVRDLRMDELLEPRILPHLLEECGRWDAFHGQLYPLERLQQTARYLMFKFKVGTWIVEDRRFRMLVEGGSWLCPYCAELTDVRLPTGHSVEQAVSEQPDESAFVAAVVGHLVRCAAFARGEDKLLPLKALEERRLASGYYNRIARAKRRYELEPSFRLEDAQGRWVCPFCAQPQDRVVRGPADLEADLPGEDYFLALASHLESCAAHRVLGGQVLQLHELQSRLAQGVRGRQLDGVRHKVQSHPVWRVRDLDSRWFCPYCARQTDVGYPAGRDGKAEERFLGAVLDHLSLCDAYARPGAQVQSQASLAEVVDRANRQIDRRRRVRKWLVDDERFGVVDEHDSWVCPYCRRSQKHIHLNIGHDSAVFEKSVEAVVDHLTAGCDSFRDGQPPSCSRRELEEQLQRPRFGQAPGAAGVGVGVGGKRIESGDFQLEEASWLRIRDDLRAVRTRVERATTSLREARSKQRRLLSDVPELPGYEFARVYKPCDAVGGDFYAFFPALDGSCQALAIGDIAGHGIEAALLMGLAKKLLEVHGRERPSTAQALCLANRDIFHDLDERTFVTAFLGLLDPQRRTLKFSRAGHDPLILFNPRRTPRLRTIDSKGMALGMDQGPIFERTIEELEIELSPGDLILQYTDGLTETMNHDNEQFGPERLFAVVEESGHNEVEYVLWKLEQAVDAFRGSRARDDDLTMIGFKVL